MRTGALKLLAAAAAYGAYRYSKMTPEQKENLKTRGKEFLNKYVGSLNGTLGGLFGQKKAATNASDY